MRLVALAGLLCIAGCGNGDRPPLGSVHGIVKLGDKALANASVTFFPEKGRPSCSETDASGHYDLIYLRDIHGAIIGKHKVVIQTMPPEEYYKEVVPARYNKKSMLEQEVVNGDNPIDFNLEPK